jgi:predicted outer membrane protein
MGAACLKMRVANLTSDSIPMTEEAMSPLRRRMIEDMTIRKLAKTQHDYAQAVGEKTGLNSALGVTPKTEDFIKEAATSDMLEIQATRLRKIAQEKGDADEKKFTVQMITDHTKTSTELMQMVPPEMTSRS